MNPKRLRKRDKSTRHSHACWLCKGYPSTGNMKDRRPVRDLREMQPTEGTGK